MAKCGKSRYFWDGIREEVCLLPLDHEGKHESADSEEVEEYHSLNRAGDEARDSRNLIDEFKGLPVKEIRTRLDKRRNPFATLLLNIDYDINIATMIRTHNVFCGQEIFYLGRKKMNRRGCVGTYLYEHITHIPTLEEAKDIIDPSYTWVGIDNIPGATPLPEFKWPKKPLLVFGHENGGLDFLPELSYSCKNIVFIPQMGSCRSLNVAVASGITMFDLANKKGWLGG